MTITTIAIVPTLNSGRTLRDSLRSLQRQSRQPNRIVIIDGGSDDSTHSIANEMEVEFFSAPGPAAHARNVGVRISEEELLFFIDSDQQAQAGLVEECVSLISRGQDAIVIPELTVGSGIIGKARAWERAVIQSDPNLVFARAIKREVFLESGGFDERLVGFEDLDLQSRLRAHGLRIGRSINSLSHHEEHVTISEYLKKRKRYMESADLFRSKQTSTRKLIFSPTNRLRLYLSGVRTSRDAMWLSITVGLRAVEFVSSG